MHRERVELRLARAYDLHATVGFLHGSAHPLVRVGDDGAVRQAVRTGAGPALLTLIGGERRLTVDVASPAAGAMDEAVGLARKLAGLPTCDSATDTHAAFHERASADGALREVARTTAGLRIPQHVDVVTAIASAVAAQLVTTSFAAKVTSALLRAHGERVEIDGGRWLLPPRAETVAALAPERLQAIQLTRRKSEYVIALCHEVAEGTLDLEGLREASAEEATRRLVARRGIGPTTAAWLLMFGAGHPDAWPPADVGLLRAIGRLRGGRRPTTTSVLRWAAPYRGVRTHLALALWQHQRVLARP